MLQSLPDKTERVSCGFLFVSAFEKQRRVILSLILSGTQKWNGSLPWEEEHGIQRGGGPGHKPSKKQLPNTDEFQKTRRVKSRGRAYDLQKPRRETRTQH